jgi:cell division GTPase FtsZ
MPQVAPAIETFASIKVVGVGGAGVQPLIVWLTQAFDGV